MTPKCPGCGRDWEIMVGDEQAFCGNDNCRVLMWNPLKSPEENQRDMHTVEFS